MSLNGKLNVINQSKKGRPASVNNVKGSHRKQQNYLVFQGGFGVSLASTWPRGSRWPSLGAPKAQKQTRNSLVKRLPSTYIEMERLAAQPECLLNFIKHLEDDV